MTYNVFSGRLKPAQSQSISYMEDGQGAGGIPVQSPAYSTVPDAMTQSLMSNVQQLQCTSHDSRLVHVSVSYSKARLSVDRSQYKCFA